MRSLFSLTFLLLVTVSCSTDAESLSVEAPPNEPPSKSRPNVLFVIIDDLRPELSCFGVEGIKTPHLDQLAGEGMVFTRAYCQAAACAPSRASAMLGRRPDSTRVWSLGEKFREIDPDAVTMPMHFAAHGYHTVSMGKIFHNHMPDRVSFIEPDLRPAEYLTPEMIDRDPESFYVDEGLKAELAGVRAERIAKRPGRYAGGWAYGKSTEATEAPDDSFYDGAQTKLALDKLAELKDREEPFFMAVGYYRPHLPFSAPKRYWDLYDRDQIPEPSNPFLPAASPFMAMNSMYELRACYDLEETQTPHEALLDKATAKRLKHGYWACVSYIDACVGRLLDGLEAMDLDDDTIVVVWGDHGWKLGEHGSWCKQTNYLDDTRVPLLIRVPGRHAPGIATDRMVELVDLYPTLSELAGIAIRSDMEGDSFAPLLEDPGREWKPAAFSHYIRRPKNSPDKQRYMGRSMVTERYHYVEWRPWDQERKTAGELAAAELYDLEVDPDENVNIAGLEENAALVGELADHLQRGWEQSRP